MPRPICVVLLAVVAAVTAGCTSAPPAPPDPFPPRPAAIDIERLDPCSLLSDELQASLEVGNGRPGTAPVRGIETRACGWWQLGTPFDYSVQLIPVDAAESVGADGTVVGSVEGYGTVRVTDRVQTYPLCEIYVDVNDGQLIRVQVRTIERRRTDGSAYPIGEVCRRAELVAADAVRNARAAP